MGLSMVHGIMHNHKGHIIVESKQATMFRLLFPLPVDSAKDNSDKNKVVSLKNKNVENMPRNLIGNILIVDDEATVGVLFGEILTACGFQVTLETDSRRALEKFKAEPDKYDLLVTDQTMPGITGAELSKIVKAIRPDLPVVLCSGYSEQLNDNIIEDYGVDKFLNKPVTTKEFITVVEGLLDAGINKVYST